MTAIDQMVGTGEITVPRNRAPKECGDINNRARRKKLNNLFPSTEETLPSGDEV